jgi:hypothetical protein
LENPEFRLQRIDMEDRNKDISTSPGVGDTDIGLLTLTVNGVTVQSRPCPTTVPLKHVAQNCAAVLRQRHAEE